MRRPRKVKGAGFVAALLLSGCVQFGGGFMSGEDEIRAAERALENALSAPDPTAWVDHYTEDAVFVSPGAPPVQGRAALLKMAMAMRPLSSVKIEARRTEMSGNLASVYGRGSWTNGAGTASQSTTAIRLIIVWRKGADGRWRVVQELFHSEPQP